MVTRGLVGQQNRLDKPKNALEEQVTGLSGCFRNIRRNSLSTKPQKNANASSGINPLSKTIMEFLQSRLKDS